VDRRAFLAALAAAPALLSGCGRGALPGPGTLRLAFPTDYKSLDPTQLSDTNTLQVLRLMYQSLLDCDDDMNLVPWLAARLPEVSADKRVYTFEVKRGVRFANGRELTADDFVYAVERAFDPITRSTGTGFLRNLRGAEAFQKAREEDAAREGPDRGKRLTEPTRLEGVRVLGDPYTLQFELDHPDLAFPWVTTLPFTYPIPHEEVERHGADFYRHPCGTGPFVLQEWQRGLRLRFAHNPHFGGPRPAGLGAVEILIGYDWLTQTMMFERGELDLLNVPPADFVRLTNDPRWGPQFRTGLMPSTDFLVMNCELKPFDDVRVRRAVCHAVNRERTMRVVHDMYLPANSFLPPGVFGHDPDRPGYAYDPDRARRLLAEAGYPDGFSVELWYPTDAAVWVTMVLAIQQDLKKVNIDVRLKEMAIEVFYAAVGRRRNVPFSICGWTADYPDAGDFLGNLCEGGKKLTDDQCNNMAFYDDPDVTRWIQDAAVAADAKERLALYRKTEDRIMRDVPYCVLCHEKANYMCQPRVKNCTMHPIWWIRYENLSLEPS
jgi:peptide/nickel transport system substrate-binding protein